MKFLICAVGHRMPNWVAAGFDEYARRMPREAHVELLEIRPEKRGEGRRRAVAERGGHPYKDGAASQVPYGGNG